MVFRVQMRRHKDGLHVNVRVAEEIEEFFKKISLGKSIPAMEAGRLWRTGKELPTVYSVMHPEAYRSFTTKRHYALLYAGGGLPSVDGIPNISLLRLVGASKPEGVSFVMDSVMTEEGLAKGLQTLQSAAEKFFMDYIRPLELGFEVFRQDPPAPRRNIEDDEDPIDDERDYDED